MSFSAPTLAMCPPSQSGRAYLKGFRTDILARHRRLRGEALRSSAAPITIRSRSSTLRSRPVCRSPSPWRKGAVFRRSRTAAFSSRTTTSSTRASARAIAPGGVTVAGLRRVRSIAGVRLPRQCSRSGRTLSAIRGVGFSLSSEARAADAFPSPDHRQLAARVPRRRADSR